MVTSTIRPLNLGDGDVVSRTKPKRYSDEELKSGIKATVDTFINAKKCVLDTSLDAYFRAGGKLVAVWFSRTQSTEFLKGKSKCYTALTPEVVDSEKVTKDQPSISSKCRLIMVEKKP